MSVMEFSAFLEKRGGLIIIYARQESVNRRAKKLAKHQKFCAEPTSQRRAAPSQVGDFRKYLPVQKKGRIAAFTAFVNEKFALPPGREARRERWRNLRYCNPSRYVHIVCTRDCISSYLSRNLYKLLKRSTKVLDILVIYGSHMAETS